MSERSFGFRSPEHQGFRLTLEIYKDEETQTFTPTLVFHLDDSRTGCSSSSEIRLPMVIDQDLKALAIWLLENKDFLKLEQGK